MELKNEFVTYEQALALKELGFDEPYFGVYGKSNGDLFKVIGDKFFPVNDRHFVKAPLKQQVFRWFRDKYKLYFNFINVGLKSEGDLMWSIIWKSNPDEAKAHGTVKTYEEAEDACIDKLIKLVKKNDRE